MPSLVAANGCSIDFVDNAFDLDQTWVNIVDHLVSVSTRRGRPSEFEKTEAGGATFMLEDRSAGLFDPTNSTSSYFAGLKPRKQAKVNFRHPIRGTYHDIFTGFTQEFGVKRIGPRGLQHAVPLVDGFSMMATGHNPPTTGGVFYDAQHVDDRIKAALADLGWPALLTRIATGNVIVQPMIYDSTVPYAQIIDDAVLAEFPGVANFFIDKSGFASFSGRGIRFGIGGATPDESYPTWIKRWRVGDAAACAEDPTLLPIFNLEFSVGDTDLYNDAICAPANFTNPDIASNHVEDAASIDQYGRSSYPLLDLMILAGTGPTGIERTAMQECFQIAEYFKNNYAQPEDRITAFEVHGQMDDGMTAPGGESGNLWDFILDVELNHIVEVWTEHSGGGGIRGKDYFVESISNEIGRLNDRMPRWTMNLELSPRARFATYP